MDTLKTMDEEQAIAAAREALGCDEDDAMVAYYEDGHSGAGWYAWHAEYPEDGSICLTVPDLRPGAEG